MRNILQDSSNYDMEVNGLSDVRKPSTSGRNDDRLEQILRQPISDPREDILDELTELAISTDRTETDNARLRQLYDELEKVCPIESIPDNAEADEAFLLELREKLNSPSAKSTADSAAAENKILKKERSINDSETPVKSPRKTWKKLLPLIATLLLLLGTVSSQASGDGLFGMFAKWTSEIFHLDNSAKPEASIGHIDMDIGEVREYDTPQEMLDDFDIKGQLLPTWLPDGLGEPECWATYDDGGGLTLRVLYETPKGYLKLQYTQVSKENTANIERDYHNVDSWELYGIHYYQVIDLELVKIVWVDGTFECSVQGSITDKEARTVVESIYEK